MITQRNADVERLNAMARTLLREEGRLGEVEIEVAGQGFAVGDQVVTRINAPADGVTNRMRWRVAEVDADRDCIILDGLDQERGVMLERNYLERENPTSGAPALQHGYAANLYIAQGATVDRALVAAEASMSQQDYYVAMSRAREAAFLYATPELQLEREEYAPRSPIVGAQLDHIRAAIERNAAQIAAVDEQLRVPLRGLSTDQLVARSAELGDQLLVAEGRTDRLELLREQAAEMERTLAEVSEQRQELEAPRRPDRRELSRLEHNQEMLRDRLERTREELALELSHEPAIDADTRAQRAATEAELAERRRLVIAADRISPPPYITAALGEKPAEPELLAQWERGIELIERHRQAHRITDRQLALGAEPPSGIERARWERTANRLCGLQRALHIDSERGLGRELGIGREIEIGFGP
jgi:hypothetical protein